MKKKQLFLVLSLAALLGFNQAVAAGNSQQAKTTQQGNDALKRFNNNVEIVFKGVEYAQNDKQQAVMNIHYDVRNKGSKAAIKSLAWDALFVEKNKVIFAHPIPLTFNGTLPAKSSVSFDVSIPMDKIPESARNVLLRKDAKITYYNGAKNIVFANGAKIVVAK